MKREDMILLIEAEDAINELDKIFSELTGTGLSEGRLNAINNIYPNDPNNFDIAACKKLDEKEVKIIVKNIYKEGTDVYRDFSGYVSKYNKSLAKKLDTCVKYEKWGSLTEREIKYLAKYIYKYYESAYKMMEHAPSKALDAIMEKAEDIVEVVY